MIKHRVQPTGGVMTTVALGAGQDVIGIFARGDRAVMAAVTQCRRLAMVYGQSKGAPAGAGGVATVALIGGQRMGCRLIGGVGSGMARVTTGGRLIMIKRQQGGQPSVGIMASFT